MITGQLNALSSGLQWTTTTWRAGGKTPLLPDASTNGSLRWNWQTTMLTGVEYRIAFEKEVYAAMIRLELPAAGVLRCAEILIPAKNGEKTVGIHRAEEGKDFGGTVEITVGTSADTFIVRLTPVMRPLELPEPAVIGAVFDEPVLYPTPSSVQWDDGSLPLETLALAADDGHPDSVFALSYYKERLEEVIAMYTIPQSWRRTMPDPVPPSSVRTAVLLRHADDLPKESYRLTVNDTGAVLEAGDRLGILYAVERLMEMANAGGVPFCRIEDRPYKEMRGFHFGLPPREEIPFLKKLLKTILIPYHYNQLIMEFAGGMRFDSHPEISEAWLEGNRKAKAGEIPEFPHGSMNSGGELLEKDEVRDFCDYARALGFELIPEVQSFGHVQYITYAHPDIAETDESVAERQMDTRNTDQPPSTYYHHSYCPQNPKSYEIIYDLIDEIVDVVKPPRFVHMGHDEIYQVGLCPKCKDVPHDRLYEMHVTAMHDYLAKKGLRMMIWADMMQPTEKYKTYPAIERLPRDIVLLDFIWYFHFDLDMEDHLLPYGYDVVMGNLYSSHYPRYESRAAKERMIGGQVST
ncbi:MAG: family 20 glycosylhydrolase [Clostridia bacterium]|nr:family 20 glycosylhydrolase [Clostridia bacterium]